MQIDPSVLADLKEGLQDELYDLCHDLMVLIKPEMDGDGLPVATEHAIQGVLARFFGLLSIS